MINLKQVFCFLFTFYGLNVAAQVDTFEHNGEDESRIILTILGDGYIENELGKFKTDAGKIVADIFSTTPFKEYQKFFNVYSISIASNETGATHPGTATDVTEPVFPVSEVDNVFGSTFDVAGIHRLVAPGKSSAIQSALANNIPAYDQAFIIVNSEEYGGSGGQFATSTADASASEIAIHEIGHSFASLKDEYWAGDQYAGEAKNMTQESNEDLVKWKEWLGIDDVGIFAYGTSGSQAEWYRPHQRCKMRILNVPFCRVCTEGIIDKIYALTDPIEAFSPENIEVELTESMEFSVDMVDPDVERYSKVWLSDEDTLETGLVNIAVDPGNLPEGESQIHFHLYDETNLSKSYLPARGYFWSTSWDVTNNATTAVKRTQDLAKFAYKIYPNPSSQRIVLEYDNPDLSIEQLQISWISLNGQEIATQEFDLNSQQGKLELSKPVQTQPIQLLRLKDAKTGWQKAIILNK